MRHLPCRLLHTVLLPLIPLAIIGCSQTPFERDSYEGTRWEKINQCNQLPEGQRDVCLEHVADEHEAYKRKQKELKGKAADDH